MKILQHTIIYMIETNRALAKKQKASARNGRYKEKPNENLRTKKIKIQ